MQNRVENAIYYGNDSLETEDFEHALAYTTTKSFYIREFKGAIFVKGTIVRREDKERFKWRKVNELCFKYYLKYLRTNQEYCYNLASRNRN